jgi:hypothetical protein
MLMAPNVEQRIANDHPLRRIKHMADAVLKDTLAAVRPDVKLDRPPIDSARAAA